MSNDDLAACCWQISAMIEAGVPLLRSLEVAAEQSPNPRLRAALSEVVADITRGKSFAAALKAHPQVFSRLFTGLVEVGELSGNTERVLAKLARYLERSAETRRNLVNALSYPVFLLAACTAVLVLLVAVVIPEFLPMFQETGASMPWVTRVLLGASVAFQAVWPALAALGALAGFGVWAALRTPKGCAAFHAARVRAPLVGPIVTRISLARFSLTLGLLLESGVPILTAIGLLRDISPDEALRAVLKDVEQRVREGSTLAEALGRHAWIPSLLLAMLKAGEESGHVPEMLARLGAHFERELDDAIRRLTRFVEPVMVMGLALVVGFIALSVFLPLSDLAAAAGK